MMCGRQSKILTEGDNFPYRGRAKIHCAAEEKNWHPRSAGMPVFKELYGSDYCAFPRMRFSLVPQTEQMP